MTAMTGHRAAWAAGGLSALAAALLWAVKSLSILLVGYQPPLVFELAVPLFGLTVVLLAQRGPPSALMRAARVVGGAACAAGLVTVGSELVGASWGGPAIATAMVAVIVGLIMIGVASRGAPKGAGAKEKLAFVIGLTTVPGILVGGFLAMLNERLLEVPILILACMWAWLGGLMLHTRLES
jgi:hypothetical protein